MHLLCIYIYIQIWYVHWESFSQTLYDHWPRRSWCCASSVSSKCALDRWGFSMFFWLLGCCLRLLATVPGFSWNLTSFSVFGFGYAQDAWDVATQLAETKPSSRMEDFSRENHRSKWNIFQQTMLEYWRLFWWKCAWLEACRKWDWTWLNQKSHGEFAQRADTQQLMRHIEIMIARKKWYIDWDKSSVSVTRHCCGIPDGRKVPSVFQFYQEDTEGDSNCPKRTFWNECSCRVDSA